MEGYAPLPPILGEKKIQIRAELGVGYKRVINNLSSLIYIVR
jgi:hypothetical protein